MTDHRQPYVGEGADGARRSAQIDREEADLYPEGSRSRAVLLDSAARWDRQVESEECECSEEYGPCEKHCVVLAQREGASLRTTDELNVLFLQEVFLIKSVALTEGDRNLIWRVNHNLRHHKSSWITDDVDLAEELYDTVHRVESNLGPEFQTYWDDGFRIVKITGGPFAEGND